MLTDYLTTNKPGLIYMLRIKDKLAKCLSSWPAFFKYQVQTLAEADYSISRQGRKEPADETE